MEKKLKILSYPKILIKNIFMGKLAEIIVYTSLTISLWASLLQILKELSKLNYSNNTPTQIDNQWNISHEKLEFIIKLHTRPSILCMIISNQRCTSVYNWWLYEGQNLGKAHYAINFYYQKPTSSRND